jgi:DNA repair protein RadC
MELVQAGRWGARELAFREGIDRLGDAELVALVLSTGAAGRGVSRVASEALEQLGGLTGLARAGVGRLAALPGLGPVKALRLLAGIELGRRLGERAVLPRPRLSSSAEVARLFGAKLGSLDHEELWIVALDGRNGAKAVRRAAQGGLHGCAVAARDVLRLALLEAASAVVLVHNHPSGDPTPSAEDVAMTRLLVEAGEIVGVAVVDHVVVARGAHASLLDLGLMP